MGTIVTRKRKDGTEAHTAQIRLKAGGRIIHSEAQTFERLPAARQWLKRREAELAEPGSLEKTKAKDPLLHEVIAQYMLETKRDFGDTKRQVLRTIQASDLGHMACSTIGSPQIVAFAQSLGVQPQTVGNYLSHLAAVFAVARPAWGYPLDSQAMADARTVAKRMAITSKSNSRDRRPTLPELELLLQHFAVQELKRASAIPMRQIVLFAIFSTRRQEEITRLQWADLDEAQSEIWVRDMKHPGEKVGNDVRVALPPEALALIALRRNPDGTTPTQGAIYPHNPESVSASFTKACQILGIEDLHFHDFRHDGISRLFELGWTIPRVANVSGHRTWSSLKRYTHMRQTGDKYAGWPVLAAMGITPEPERKKAPVP